MKIISSSLDAHLASEVTTIATCWQLTRRDAVTMGFTDHDQDISFAGLIYQAASGFTPSAIANNSELSVDNLDIEGAIDSSLITQEDIHAGLYDYAQIEIFIVNYENLSQGALNLRTGWLGEVSFTNNNFIAEVRGLIQNLAQGIGELYSPSCRAQLGDSRCGVDLAGFTVNSAITNVSNQQLFSDTSLSQANGWFSAGIITFTSGRNIGLSMEIKEFRNQQINLVLPMPYMPAVNDSYTIIAGCDKSLAACKNKFANVVNFRGEPHIPGIDKMLETAGTRNN